MQLRTSPRYPIFIPSKGRAENYLTMKALDRMGVDYRVVVEPQEKDAYIKTISEEKLLVLPFHDRGLPATREWIYQYATALGMKRHWQLDDNIRSFSRLNRNKHTKVRSGVCFRIIEDFTDRYLNVAISGMQYKMFMPVREDWRPFCLNHRVYSCMLFLNGLHYKWLSRNEDTDMSIQVLKDGWCTLNFYVFTAEKMATMQMKGGMSGDYKSGGRIKMAEELQYAHPDITKIKWKWGR